MSLLAGPDCEIPFGRTRCLSVVRSCKRGRRVEKGLDKAQRHHVDGIFTQGFIAAMGAVTIQSIFRRFLLPWWRKKHPKPDPADRRSRKAAEKIGRKLGAGTARLKRKVLEGLLRPS